MIFPTSLLLCYTNNRTEGDREKDRERKGEKERERENDLIMSTKPVVAELDECLVLLSLLALKAMLLSGLPTVYYKFSF